LNGRCIAGLWWDGEEFGSWIRPISSIGHGELFSERFYKDGGDPQLLDVIELSLLEGKPNGCHVEDFLVDPSKKWRREGSLPFDKLLPYVSKAVGPLWFNGSSTSNGENDSIPAREAEKLSHSLMLIRPKHLTLTSTREGWAGRVKRKVRGSFSWGRYNYTLSVTDPVIENELGRYNEGESREVDDPILCLSVGEKFDQQNAHYKLIAGVIEEEEAE